METDLSTTACPELMDELRRLLGQRLSSDQLDLPVLPEVAVKLMALVNDPDYRASHLAQLIRRDASIASHLLRIANSAMYSQGAPIVSLNQAIARLGIRKIREIVLIISCQNRVFKVEAFEQEVRASFRNSLAAAAFAQEIARARRAPVEDAFLCGLLHDVGRPVLLQAVVDLQPQLQDEQSPQGLGRLDAMSVVDELRIAAGSHLIDRWNLPERVAEAVGHQDAPADAPRHGPTAHLTNLAIALAQLALEPQEPDVGRISEHPSIPPLNLYPDQVESLIDKRDAIAAWVEESA